MSFLGLILLIIIIYFVVLPLVRVWMAVNRARKQARSMFGADQRRQQRQYQQPRPSRHHKKIDPDVGEYVDYEDLPSYSETTYTETTYTEVKYETEDQVSDADWEEIK